MTYSKTDGMLQRSMEERLDVMQSELERLESYGGDCRSERSRDVTRTSSPGELAKPRTVRARATKRSRPPPTRRWSSDRTCRCRCNTFFSDTRNSPAADSDRQLQQVQQDLAEATGQKQTMQERIYELEEAQKQDETDQEEIRNQLEEERDRTQQMEQDNMDLKEQIQRLEMDLSNLPVGDCGSMREASVQITQLLQTLNEDMVKAPELCTRLRMAAQQIIDVEKRCANERGARSMDQQEVQFLRSENQRLREVAFRANMSAFQATVQVPQGQMTPYGMQGMAGPQGYADPMGNPYGNMGMQGQGMQGAPGMGGPQVRRKSMFQRVFRKNSPEDMGPATLQYQDGSRAQFDPMMSLQQQRLSVALQENPDEAAKRLQMLNQDKRKGCCPR
ncbi:ankyrin repeat domain-containing protein 26-like isoform X2 [Pollicipes pollicipes]|uniref:ankyrin repeat domain-containing protein 26-like isoform X2 n=1 Tax=Pollicipes pollicipes TaxID=41117 RepID=UPI001884A177|nr:ankyrin repeat domain-containing protein 26-like isoform X2 [Pollicipes pollicipes]